MQLNGVCALKLLYYNKKREKEKTVVQAIASLYDRAGIRNLYVTIKNRPKWHCIFM